MESERELVARSLDFQARARDFAFMELPGYMAWSERKLAEGESEALIAHMDCSNFWLLPEEAAEIEVSFFDEYLEELREEIG
jgi:hypothetical protein